MKGRKLREIGTHNLLASSIAEDQAYCSHLFFRSILCRYRKRPFPIAIQQAVMRRLQNFAQANLKLGRNYRSQNSLTPSAEPPPEQPGWKAMKSASIPFAVETVKLLLKKWYRTNWHICWYGNISAA